MLFVNLSIGRPNLNGYMGVVALHGKNVGVCFVGFHNGILKNKVVHGDQDAAAGGGGKLDWAWQSRRILIRSTLKFSQYKALADFVRK